MGQNLVRELVEGFKRLPGISLKHSEKLVYALLSDKTLRAQLESTVQLLKSVVQCDRCGCFHTSNASCLNCGRNGEEICVVSTYSDMLAIENSGEFSGSFHVLGGVVAPLDGVMPEDLLLDSLVERIGSGDVREIVLALPSTIEGEATVHYIFDKVKDFDIKVTRIGRGLPSDAKLEFMDKRTISIAFHERQKLT